jgi:excisionase family DNA binding protein
MEFANSSTPSLCLNSAQCHSQVLSIAARNFNQTGDAMDQKKMLHSPKLGWTLEELARSLSVSVPFLRLEVKRGRLRAAHLGRRVVLLDRDVQRYLADASDRAA